MLKITAMHPDIIAYPLHFDSKLSKQRSKSHKSGYPGNACDVLQDTFTCQLTDVYAANQLEDACLLLKDACLFVQVSRMARESGDKW